MRPAIKPTPADILFVVDNSGSMLDDQERLAESFDRFVEQIAGRGDHQIAVITTDTSGRGEYEGRSRELNGAAYPFTAAYPSPLDLSDCRRIEPRIENGCFRGSDPARRVIKTSDPDALPRLRENLIVGSCGDGTERGLDAVERALAQMAPGECNEGFLRPEANLVVIFVSDEDDHGEAEVGRALEALIAAKGGSARQVRVGVIVGSADGQAAACKPGRGAACGSYCGVAVPPGSRQRCDNSTPCPNGEVCAVNGNFCDSPENLWRDYEPNSCASCTLFPTEDCCSALSGERYVRFAQGVENRVTQDDQSIVATGCRPTENQLSACLIDTICQDNFGETLERFANQLIAPDRYALDPPAVNPSGVLVTLRGGRYGDGTTLEPGTDYMVSTDGAVLTLRGDKVPAAATEEVLDIYYAVEVRGPIQGQGACAAP